MINFNQKNKDIDKEIHMPYIKKERRPICDEIVTAMHAAGIKADGDLNYILYAFCKRYVPASYNQYKNYISELQETATEIRRRILGPYEDQKIIENGDV